MNLLYVGMGGAIGAMLRYALAAVGSNLVARTDIPFPTLAANVLGSLLMGAALAWFQRQPDAEGLRLFLTTGLLGGFTTFSAFSGETLHLLQRGQTGLALGYIATSLLGCLLAAWLGYAAVARAL